MLENISAWPRKPSTSGSDSSQPQEPVPRCVFRSILWILYGYTAVALLYDLLMALPWTKNLLQKLASPFRNFLQLEDLAQFDPMSPIELTVPKWKRRVLVIGGFYFVISLLVNVVLRGPARQHLTQDQSPMLLACWVRLAVRRLWACH